jgi:hypothetical protein
MYGASFSRRANSITSCILLPRQVHDVCRSSPAYLVNNRCRNGARTAICLLLSRPKIPAHKFWRGGWKTTSRHHPRCRESWDRQIRSILQMFTARATNRRTSCALYQSRGDLECKIARCWAFCGPHLPLDRHFAIGNFIRDVLADRPIQIMSDGTPTRSYLYAADLAVWLWTILFRAPALVPFNVGSEHDISILELAETVAATLNPRTEIRVAQQAVSGTPPLRYVPCVARARELLGLRETIGLEECIRRTARWYEG